MKFVEIAPKSMGNISTFMWLSVGDGMFEGLYRWLNTVDDSDLFFPEILRMRALIHLAFCGSSKHWSNLSKE